MNKYRSLDAWKRAHTLALRTLQVTDAAFNMRRRNVFDQLRRAAISVEALEELCGASLATIRGLMRKLPPPRA
jgi:four helix bundle protein